MAHYKAPDNSVHFLEDASYEHFLPAGSEPITDEEAEMIRQAAMPQPDSLTYAQLRELAYKLEADPLFFQEQRGEVPAGTWAAKIAEIKARYPKP